MTQIPCRAAPAECHGAKLTADHLESTSFNLHGDYELKMRGPFRADRPGQPAESSPGVYAYFTAGYVSKAGVWNEVNFGFHPDRDANGTLVSCEHHDDVGRSVASHTQAPACTQRYSRTHYHTNHACAHTSGTHARAHACAHARTRVHARAHPSRPMSQVP